MAIKQGLLALLNEGPAYGFALKAMFEERTGATWPLNIGQVYTTLARCERDGLVTQAEPDHEGRVIYEITEAGRKAVAHWFYEPVRRADADRDELAIKLAVGASTPGVDVRAIVQAQRTETMRALQQLTRLKFDATDETDISHLLVLERLIFDTEAEIRWLDHCETRLLRATSKAASTQHPQPTAADNGASR